MIAAKRFMSLLFFGSTQKVNAHVRAPPERINHTTIEVTFRPHIRTLPSAMQSRTRRPRVFGCVMTVSRPNDNPHATPGFKAGACHSARERFMRQCFETTFEPIGQVFGAAA